ncbi:MAG TPA: hypothetical protein VG602_07130 [Actinomycetota bacterium]|nr:hypothetical protein [Actinomycetota bacterium]
MSRQTAVLVALIAIALAALFISVGSLILLRRNEPDRQTSDATGRS